MARYTTGGDESGVLRVAIPGRDLLTLDEFELREPQRITRRVETLGGILLGQPLVLGEEGRQLQ